MSLDFGSSSAVSGAAGGATAGLVAGPIGALAGGALGYAAGLFGGPKTAPKATNVPWFENPVLYEWAAGGAFITILTIFAYRKLHRR